MNSKEYEMKVVEKIISTDKWLTLEYLCPRCNVNLDKVIPQRYKCKYCPECGQKVWWY